MSAGVHPSPRGLQMPPAPVNGTDGFSTYGASASMSSALGFSEAEEEENRFIMGMGDETEVEREGSAGKGPRVNSSSKSLTTPVAPGLERK